MARKKFIVVGIDGSGDGLRAAEYATHAAQLRGKGIRLVHAYHLNAAVSPLTPIYGTEEFRAFGRASLEDAERRIAELAPDLTVERALVAAPRGHALVHASQSPTVSMVVVGRRHISTLQRVLTGSTSTVVAARAPVPVVSVPVGWPDTDSEPRIVVGSDGSAQGQDAMAYAFAEADRLRTSLMVVRAWELPPRWATDVAADESAVGQWVELAELTLSEDLVGWADSYPDVQVSRVIERSPSPADALVGRSAGATALVIGARGHGGLPGLDLGWTARGVLARAQVPVVVVHRGDLLEHHNELLVPAIQSTGR